MISRKICIFDMNFNLVRYLNIDVEYLSSVHSGTSQSSNRSSDTGNNSSPLLPSAGACRCFVPFKKSVKGNIDRVTPRFSGMSLGDVMKVTVMQEMEQLNMERSKPLDLSC